MSHVLDEGLGLLAGLNIIPQRSLLTEYRFEDLVDATATVSIGPNEIDERFEKRPHNPQHLAAGFDKTNVQVPWLGGKRLRLIIG
jgi:hypothetical protein